jgi:hypothetical protein
MFVGSTPSGLGGRVGFAIRRLKPAATRGRPLPGPATVLFELRFSSFQFPVSDWAGTTSCGGRPL